MIVFNSRNESLHIQVKTPADARVIFSVAINDKEVLWTDPTKTTVSAQWTPAPSDRAGSVTWRFAIASAAASYELTIRQAQPGQDPAQGEIVYTESGTSSESGTKDSVGNLVVILPRA